MLFWICLIWIGLVRASFYSDDVIEVVPENFDAAVIRDVEVVTVQFYDPSSKACRKFKPELEKAARSVSGFFRIIAIDISSESGRKLFESMSFTNEGAKVELPAIRVFQGQKVHVFEGESGADLETFLKQLVKPKLTELTAKSSKKFFKNTEMPKALFFDDDKSQDALTAFGLLSVRLSGRMEFAKVSKGEKKLLKAYDLTASELPKVVVVPAHTVDQNADDDYEPEAPRRVFSQPLSGKGDILFPFLDLNALPANYEDPLPVPELADSSCLTQLCSATGKLCAIAVMPASNRASLRYDLHQFKATATSKGLESFAFMWLNAEKQAAFVQQAFGLFPGDYAQLVVLSMQKMRFVEFVGSFTHEQIGGFLRGVARGAHKTEPLRSGKNLPLLIEASNSKLCPDFIRPTVTPEEAKGQSKPGSAAASAKRGSHPDAEVRLRARDLKHKANPPVHDVTNDIHAIVRSPAAWLVRIFDPSSGEANEASAAVAFSEAAAQLKNMVGFAQWDASKTDHPPALLAKLFAPEKLPAVLLFSPGEHSKGDFTLLRGESHSKEGFVGAAKGLLSDDLCTFVANMQVDFQTWMMDDPLGPRMLYIGEDNKAPLLLRALSYEFAGHVRMAYTTKTSEVATQFYGKEKTISTGLMLLDTSLDEKTDLNNQPQVRVSANNIPKGQQNFQELAAMLDEIVKRRAHKDKSTPNDKEEL